MSTVTLRNACAPVRRRTSNESRRAAVCLSGTLEYHGYFICASAAALLIERIPFPSISGATTIVEGLSA